MKIRISDLMDYNCPESVSLGARNKDMARRIESMVMKKIDVEQPKPHRIRKKTLRTLLLAAVIAALLGTAAYAVSGWFMSMKKTDETVTGYWRAVDAAGNLTDEQKIVFPDAGMILSFEGPKERRNRPEFRCWYLPSEASFGYTDEEGWTQYLSDQGGGTGPEIPYIVSAGNVRAGNFKTVINGDVTLAKEEDWGDWHITMLTSDYTGCEGRWLYERANFVLLFNAEKGWLVSVTGTDPLDTLEHIARELEIRDSGEPAFTGEDNMVESIGMIDPGRG